MGLATFLCWVLRIFLADSAGTRFINASVFDAATLSKLQSAGLVSQKVVNGTNMLQLSGSVVTVKK